MPTAYGYLRVSSDAQAASGLGLDAQLQRIQAEQGRLEAAGASVGPVYRDEAVSAVRHAMRERPAGSALDAAVQAGDHVCIAMLDRAFRTQRDAAVTLEAWLSRGVTVHLLDIGADTSTPLGQLTVGILAAVAQWESQRIGERIRDAKAVQRRAGRSDRPDECRSATIRVPPKTSQLILALPLPTRIVLGTPSDGAVQQRNDDQHGRYGQGAIHGQFPHSVAQGGLCGRRFDIRRRSCRRRRSTWYVRVEGLGTWSRERLGRANRQFECLEQPDARVHRDTTGSGAANRVGSQRSIVCRRRVHLRPDRRGVGRHSQLNRSAFVAPACFGGALGNVGLPTTYPALRGLRFPGILQTTFIEQFIAERRTQPPPLSGNRFLVLPDRIGRRWVASHRLLRRRRPSRKAKVTEFDDAPFVFAFQT